jgi:hypothetical protein
VSVTTLVSRAKALAADEGQLAQPEPRFLVDSWASAKLGFCKARSLDLRLW